MRWIVRLAALGDEEYGTKEHTGDFELVAEATALRTLASFGMTIDSAGDHLSTIGGKNWKGRLDKTKIRYRYHAATGKLAKPQCSSDEFAAGRRSAQDTGEPNEPNGDGSGNATAATPTRSSCAGGNRLSRNLLSGDRFLRAAPRRLVASAC